MVPKNEDGYELWLRYPRVADEARLSAYREQLTAIVGPAGDATLARAIEELQRGLSGLLGREVPVGATPGRGALIVGTAQGSPLVRELGLEARLARLGAEGFLIESTTVRGAPATIVAASSSIGVLYGAFHLLRLLQTERDIASLSLEQRPRVGYRVLNHWDNLDRTIERGYAGFSLWDWQRLPDIVDPRYTDYARACASIGLNGSVLTNVNANALVLSDLYLDRVAALAAVFRPYGIKVYLTARFSAPVELGKLKTADPLAPEVQAWWKQRADAIYERIPDFGGFAVKANSEGQPGPQNYGRSHADGANMLADALGERGIVMWRAFVYDHEVPDDRAKQAYSEFVPLDGTFRKNVLVQVKNGPIDFMPREPFHPLFGAMPKTPLLLEFQLTQEYLGCATHLCYLAPLMKEVLDADTYVRGEGSTVGRVIDGSLDGHALSGIAAVTNIGNDRNWCGHPFAQSNWYAYGRLCWDHGLSAEVIAEEWLRMTFSNDRRFVVPALDLMLRSREAVVEYMNPLGLHHQMAVGHHYGPGPWVAEGRPDWTSVYYHRADGQGIGFDRTASGSDALGQYAPPVRAKYAELERCPEEYLLWFHHVAWDQRLSSGNTLWVELCQRFQRGVNSVRAFQTEWSELEPFVDAARFELVSSLLAVQEKEARWWRDSCTLYFQTFAKRPLPPGYEPAEKTLEEYRAIRHYYVPGIHNPFSPSRSS
ncbi:MAG: alpha-glucuronidase family glycosyl hydrolase [Polyangiaceae bacterium]